MRLIRRWVRTLLRIRTVCLLEQVDSDAQHLNHLRRVAIPIALAQLAGEKADLLSQLVRLQPEEATPPLPDLQGIPR